MNRSVMATDDEENHRIDCRRSQLRQRPHLVKLLGPEPTAASTEDQGFGWKNKCGKGNAGDTITSGLEGAWTSDPAKFTHDYLKNLFAFEWVQTKTPAGATVWIPKVELPVTWFQMPMTKTNVMLDLCSPRTWLSKEDQATTKFQNAFG
ncbi:MAG: hypothetical protein R2877_03020 [Bdellovibrionota bacterium]